jgi:predicted nucleic acid-binding protein
VSGWVLDCSLALAFGLPDEESSKADRFLGQLTERYDVWVPTLWWYEVSNALRVARRRKRVSDAQVAQLVDLYGRLPLRTDALFAGAAFQRYTELSAGRGLSSYDSAYLELAARRGLGLATLDTRLAKAARKIGVGVWQ